MPGMPGREGQTEGFSAGQNAVHAVLGPVYVPGRGVGVAVSWRSGRDEDGLAHPYWNVLFGLNEDSYDEGKVYRAIPSFVGWFYMDHDGWLKPVPPPRMNATTVSGRMSCAQPALQNIPIRPRKV